MIVKELARVRLAMSADAEEGFPWYVKAMIALTILVILVIVVIDLFEFAGAV